MKRTLLMRHACAALLLAACGTAIAAQAYPSSLPPEQAVRGYFENLPEIRSAQARLDLEAAQAQRLRAGPYEWTARATVQRRTEEITGTRYRESGLGLERPVRWFGKAGKDAAIGDQRIRIAHFALADAWHEAGRAFLKSWYDALREARAASLLQEQVALQEQQLDIVRKRVKAGDAPGMDRLLAEAERDRAVAAQRQAAQRAARTAAELQQHYQGVQLVVPNPVPRPEPASRSVDDWVRHIAAENHEIDLADAEANLARLNAQRSAQERMPDPTVGVHVMQERDRQEKIVGVTVSIPLPGGARRAQSAASAAESVMAQEKAQQVHNRVQRDATAVAMAAESTFENWERLARLAERSRDNAALVSKAYSLGEVSIGEALLARRQSLDAVASAESAQFDALEAQARLMLDAHAIWEMAPHEGEAP